MPRPQKGISKMDAVRQAIAKLGKDAKPGDILGFLKENFSLTMSPAMASTYKGSVLREGKGKRRGRKPGKKTAPIASENGARAVAITLEDIQAVKTLADRIGAEKVRQLAAVLAK